MFVWHLTFNVTILCFTWSERSEEICFFNVLFVQWAIQGKQVSKSNVMHVFQLERECILKWKSFQSLTTLQGFRRLSGSLFRVNLVLKLRASHSLGWEEEKAEGTRLYFIVEVSTIILCNLILQVITSAAQIVSRKEQCLLCLKS